MLGILPPQRTGLDVDGVRLKVLEELPGAVGKSGGGVGGADEGEGPLIGGIGEGELGVVEGTMAVGHSAMDVAVDISCPDEPVYHFAHNNYI